MSMLRTQNLAENTVSDGSLLIFGYFFYFAANHKLFTIGMLFFMPNVLKISLLYGIIL